MSATQPRKSTQKQIDYARAWNLAHPDIVRANKRKSYRKHHPLLKPPPTPHERFDQLYTPVTESGCWLWLGATNSKGYGLISWERHSRAAHRVAWILFKGPIPENVHVLHHCDVSGCVNPEHLFLGSNKDNVDDRVRKNRQIRGEMIHSAILTEDDVLSIRMIGRTLSQRAIAQQFGVSASHICKILAGKKWKHVVEEQAQQ